jgi:hypothetical protein
VSFIFIPKNFVLLNGLIHLYLTLISVVWMFFVLKGNVFYQHVMIIDYF